MRIAMFYHSLLSDWNHGNAHFLRGVTSELRARRHRVTVFEPRDAWSLQNLLESHGREPIAGFRAAYPGLTSVRYDRDRLDLDEALRDADLVIVHEWNDHDLVARIGRHAQRRGHYALLFHDTHHRSVSEPRSMAKYDLSRYDGVLAFGRIVRDIYLRRRWAKRAWVWHEAADTRVFRPLPAPGGRKDGDLIWIGNWGDEERTAELHEYLLKPVKALGLRAKVHGVRYPERALRALEKAGIEYGGWLPNYAAPEAFARYRVTVHVPRRPYVQALRGIPTIRPFEAMACGIPLVCSPWHDDEHLFTPGEDYLVGRDGREMKRHLKAVLEDRSLARRQARHGLETIRARHTCAHRVDELMEVCRELGVSGAGAEVGGAVAPADSPNGALLHASA